MLRIKAATVVSTTAVAAFLFLIEKATYLEERWQMHHRGLFGKSGFGRLHHSFRIPGTGNNHASNCV